ncbi:MAG: T9SS type A sorting domain-containing protein [Tannerella sp.]|jgi:hypothetical protein|nr:T9SS type A sorting domain-containing protein [Tannerella sp.]
MKRQLSYFAVIFCLLMAGQAGAQTPGFLKKHKRTVAKQALRNSSQTGELPVFPLLSGTRVDNPAAQQVARPTTVYREYSSQSKEKYECEYDTYGHITSLRVYEWDGSDYTSQQSVVREYHQLPNGKFVKTKEEFEYKYSEFNSLKRRYTSAYDSKGMQLWHQYETFDFSTSKWEVGSRTEARLENGIRTAILRNGEVDGSYTFDNKGRITHQNETYTSGTYSISYTWDDNDRIVRAVTNETWDENGDDLPDESYTYTYNNIQIVYNEKYFDPYSLSPLDFDSDSDDADISFISWGNFSVDDYTLHEVYYNIDATGVENDVEMQAQMRTTVDEGGNRIVQTIAFGTEIAQTITISVLDGYGSYRILELTQREGEYEHSVTYNEYGELVRRYENETYEEEEYEYEYVYNRERDDLKRPVKTTYSYTFSYGGQVSTSDWEETYDAWTTVDLPSGIRETAGPAVSVYFAPDRENILLSGVSGKAAVVLSGINGQILLRCNMADGEAISVSHLPAGMYFVSIRSNGRTSTHKFIKK